MAGPAAEGSEACFRSIPVPVAVVVERRMAEERAAGLGGGCVRDLLLSVPPDAWDVATSAPPDVVAQLLPGATWENPFGTVTVRAGPEPMAIEVTTYRIEGDYRDRRRPDAVRWGDSLVDDLGRRDFT